MDPLTWIWIASAGAAAGLLNALLSDNAFLWPFSVTLVANRRIIRPGLVGNVVIGAGAGVAVAGLLGAGRCASVNGPSREFIPVLVAASLVGLCIVSVITGLVDKRLLRAAITLACAAPASHPDTARSLSALPAAEVYLRALELLPRSRSHQ